MTFYELEKICKKRKIFFILSVFMFVILIILIFLGIILFKQKSTFIKKEHKKIVIKKENKRVKNKHTKKIKKNIKYLPLIDLNIKEVNVNVKSNNKKVSKKENNNSLIIKTEKLPSFNTCIELSKEYFKNKDYKDALKWAKLANLQNKKNPLSWIIAAKSLYQLGKKKEAIKLLKIYNSYYNNKEIEKLLKEFNEN